MSTLVLYSGVMNILRMSVTSCSVELFLDILLYEQIFSPTFQCGSYVYLLQMFVHMHINTAVWISAHFVSLHEHRQAYNMDVCILIFTLIPTKCGRQWNQKIFINQQMRRMIPSYMPPQLLPSRCKPPSVLDDLPYSPGIFHMLGSPLLLGCTFRKGLGWPLKQCQSSAALHYLFMPSKPVPNGKIDTFSD